MSAIPTLIIRCEPTKGAEQSEELYGHYISVFTFGRDITMAGEELVSVSLVLLRLS
jgi:hypothetical protein